MDMFMVVEDKRNVMANAGDKPKGSDHFLGLEKATADADASGRNERAAALGIQTRYSVVPLA